MPPRPQSGSDGQWARRASGLPPPGPEQVKPSWAITTLTVIATVGTAIATVLATVARDSRHDSGFKEAR